MGNREGENGGGERGGGGVSKRDRLLGKIEKLAMSRVNDAVRLAFLREGELEILDELDLSPVSEFKRNSGGTVEIKFIDRLSALQWLLENLGDDPRAKALYAAIEKGADRGETEGTLTEGSEPKR